MVSLDDAERNRAFAESMGADFVLLSDPSGTTAERYGVLAMGGLYARRITHYIDAQGRVAFIDRDVAPDRHGPDVIARLEALGFPRRGESSQPPPGASTSENSSEPPATNGSAAEQ